MARFARYRHGERECIGVIHQDLVHRVTNLPDEAEDRMVALIRANVQNGWEPELEDTGTPISSVELLAPIRRPDKNVICVGLNYHAHASEFSSSGYDSPREADNRPAPSAPIVFTKAPSSLIGPHCDIVVPWNLTREVDYEAELAVIIGRPGRAIPKEEAMDHVWGYSVVNDVTARDLQKAHKQWFLGKSIDTFCPMGPAIATADEIDLTTLELRCWVNNELRQDASLKDLIFDIPTLIATISASTRLEPGDIIATGTPQGVGIGFDPPRFLARGDRVRIEVPGVGMIENAVT